jgi:hypothetical protein
MIRGIWAALEAAEDRVEPCLGRAALFAVDGVPEVERERDAL